MKTLKLTKEGLLALEKELEYLKTEKRTEIAEKIKEARSFGDLSENSEYDEAMNDQAKIESRIAELETMIRNSEIVDESELASDRITVGSKVEIQNAKTKDKLTVSIVGTAEAKPALGKISDESPIGKALVGSKEKQTVEVFLPDGDVVKYKILKISK